MWLVPRSDSIPHWLGMVHIFQPSVWAAGFSFIALTCTAIWFSGRRNPYEVPCYTRFNDICLIVIGIMINNVPPLKPKTRHIQIVFVLWLFFSLNWTSAYTSSLVTMITTTLRADNEVLIVCMGITYSRDSSIHKYMFFFLD